MFNYENAKKLIKENLINLIPADAKKDYKIAIEKDANGTDVFNIYRKENKKKICISTIPLETVYNTCKQFSTKEEYLDTLSVYVDETIKNTLLSHPTREYILENVSLFVIDEASPDFSNFMGDLTKFASFTFRGLTCIYNINPVIDAEDEACEAIRLIPLELLNELGLRQEDLFDIAIANLNKIPLNMMPYTKTLKETLGNAIFDDKVDKEGIDVFLEYINIIKEHNIKYIDNGTITCSTLLVNNEQFEKICDKLKCKGLYIMFPDPEYLLIMPAFYEKNEDEFKNFCDFYYIECEDDNDECIEVPAFYYNKRLDFLFRINDDMPSYVT